MSFDSCLSVNVLFYLNCLPENLHETFNGGNNRGDNKMVQTVTHVEPRRNQKSQVFGVAPYLC